MKVPEIRESIRLRGEYQSSNAELVAAVTGWDPVAVARFIDDAGGLRPIAQMSAGELEARGMTHVRACNLRAAVEIGRRTLGPSGVEHVAIRQPDDVVHLLRPTLGQSRRELLVGLYCDTKHQVRRVEHVYQGTVCAASVRTAEILRPAIVEDLPNIIIAHNHPSGDPTPSPEDTAVTRRLVNAAEFHDITVLDHVIIGDRGFVSMAQRGLAGLRA